MALWRSAGRRRGRGPGGELQDLVGARARLGMLARLPEQRLERLARALRVPAVGACEQALAQAARVRVARGEVGARDGLGRAAVADVARVQCYQQVVARGLAVRTADHVLVELEVLGAGRALELLAGDRVVVASPLDALQREEQRLLELQLR